MSAAGRTASDRVAPAAFVAAGLLIPTAALLPTADDPADYGAFLEVLVDNVGRTKVVLLTVPLGIWLLAVAVAVLGNAEARGASVWLRVGLVAVVIGAAAATVSFARHRRQWTSTGAALLTVLVWWWRLPTWGRSRG